MNSIPGVHIRRYLQLLSITTLFSVSAFCQSGNGLLRLGKEVPPITCDDMHGNCVPLESLRDKLVLIEFWSSTNHSSMIDHAEMEKVYSEFKDADFKNGNGFEIYSIALDNSDERWQLARIRDNNSWQYTMCNPDKWNAKVAMDYNIQTIPKYFLIDGNGELIENLFMIKDLRMILSRYSNKSR